MPLELEDVDELEVDTATETMPSPPEPPVSFAVMISLGALIKEQAELTSKALRRVELTRSQSFFMRPSYQFVTILAGPFSTDRHERHAPFFQSG